MYTTRWRLVYADDTVVDESSEGSSIRDVRPVAAELQLVRHDTAPATAFLRIPLLGERPVFYRWRGLSLDGKGETSTDWIVFGKGHIGREGNVESELWQWTPEGGAVPASQVAPAAVAMLLED